nr:MAG TPA: hypothetical protein [Caudoviricetes sp.]
MKILDYIKNSRFEVTVQYIRKGEILHSTKILKKILHNHEDKYEILSKYEGYTWEDYYECELKMKKNCYFIYNIDSYSDLDSNYCDLYYNVIDII